MGCPTGPGIHPTKGRTRGSVSPAWTDVRCEHRGHRQLLRHRRLVYLQSLVFRRGGAHYHVGCRGIASGQPLYPALDAPERYVHIYGPILFIVHTAAFAVVGASILASKAVGSIAAFSSLGLTYAVYSGRAGVLAASNVPAASALVYLCFSNATFWTRSDPLLILFVSIGLAGVLSSLRLAAAIVLGLATGAAINLKVT